MLQIKQDITLYLNILNDSKTYRYKGFETKDGKKIESGLAHNTIATFTMDDYHKVEVLKIKIKNPQENTIVNAGKYELTIPNTYIKPNGFYFETQINLSDLKKIK